MIIEIDEKDFKEIQDKIGDIRATAIVSKMIGQENSVHRLDLITSWANEITALLDKGHLTPEADTTKFIERYNYWMCETCCCVWPISEGTPGVKRNETEYIKCPECDLKITEFVPLVREGG